MLATMHDVLPPEMFEPARAARHRVDSPMVGEAFATADVPGPDVYNLRRKRNGRPEIDVQHRREIANSAPNPWASTPGDAALGSNNWAVSRALTPDGRALVANDMHLDIRVPNTWYRAVLEWRTETDSSQTPPRRHRCPATRRS
jgi:penicillin amidase